MNNWRPDVYYINGEDVVSILPGGRIAKFLSALAEKQMLEKLRDNLQEAGLLSRSQYRNLDSLPRDDFAAARFLSQIHTWGLIEAINTKPYSSLWKQVDIGISKSGCQVLKLIKEEQPEVFLSLATYRIFTAVDINR